MRRLRAFRSRNDDSSFVVVLAVILGACGSRTSLDVTDVCFEEGAVTACGDACGDGQQVCLGGHLQPCEVPVAIRSCANDCGEGRETCTSGAWSACDVPPAMRACSNDCGVGTEACTGGAWTVCQVPVATRVCMNDCGPGGQTCTNGAWAVCQVPVATRVCSTICGQGRETCIEGTWQPCDAPRPGPPDLRTTIRDFNDTHPDFERPTNQGGLDLGIVGPDLGPDDKPVFTGPTMSTTDRAHFDQWYRDTPGVNLSTTLQLGLTPSATKPNVWVYDNDEFFPIDNQLLGNQGRVHNYHFTLELATQFRYNGGETFQFRGDDDLWVFINRKLAINLGGFHQAMAAIVSLDALSAQFGITRGGVYPFHLFFAERHTVDSTLHIETSIAEFANCP